LDKAMKNLTVAGDKADGGGKSTSDTPKKAVKIEATDISLLVEQLDLTKPKATELLRANDGDAVKAMTVFVGAALA
jgi:NACalpha-BTF3-like transcription factor